MNELLGLLLATVLVSDAVLAGAPRPGPTDVDGSRRTSASPTRQLILANGTVLVGATLLSLLLHHWLLRPFGLEYLLLLAFACAAAALALVSVRVRGWRQLASSRMLALLIGNPIVLGAPLITRLDRLAMVQAIVQAVAIALAFGLALFAFAALRDRFAQADVPASFRGTPIALLTAALMGLALLGLAGLVPVP